MVVLFAGMRFMLALLDPGIPRRASGNPPSPNRNKAFTRP
jgi:hypothetical protein